MIFSSRQCDADEELRLDESHYGSVVENDIRCEGLEYPGTSEIQQPISYVTIVEESRTRTIREWKCLVSGWLDPV